MSLPLCNILARAAQVACLHAGVTLGHAASPAALVADLGTFKPTFLLVSPRILQKVRVSAEHQVTAAGRSSIAAAAIRFSTSVDSTAGGGAKGPGWALRAMHAVFERLLYRKLRMALGGRLRYVLSGGSTLAPADTDFFRRIGIPVLEGYGLTESTGPCTANTPARTTMGSAGIPLPGTTIRVAENGEILVKGIGVFRGYRGNEAANAEVFADGFFRTGDVGELDTQGFLTITRKTSAGRWREEHPSRLC